MKKLIIFIFTIIYSISISAELISSRNYQGNDAKSYIGSRLVVLPIKHEKDAFYSNFKKDYFTINDSKHGVEYFYHYDYVRDNGLMGTRIQYLENRIFDVINVELMAVFEYTWLFTLKDIETEEIVKYVYNGSLANSNSPKDFPFATIDYLQFLYDKYLNQEVVVATRDYWSSDRYYYNHDFINIDLHTSEEVSYNNVYETFTVNAIIADTIVGQLTFELKKGENIVRTTIGYLYEETPVKYRSNTKIFLKSEWDTLCNKYGKGHMNAIMDGKIINGMTVEEARMSRGKEGGTTKMDGDIIEYAWTQNGVVTEAYVHNGKVISLSEEGAKEYLTRIIKKEADDVKTAAEPVISDISSTVKSFLSKLF